MTVCCFRESQTQTLCCCCIPNKIGTLILIIMGIIDAFNKLYTQEWWLLAHRVLPLPFAVLSIVICNKNLYLLYTHYVLRVIQFIVFAPWFAYFCFKGKVYVRMMFKRNPDVFEAYDLSAE